MKRRVKSAAISDLVLGKLSPEESMRLIEQMENDPGASEDLELATEMLNVAGESGGDIFERAQVPGSVHPAVHEGLRPYVKRFLGEGRIRVPAGIAGATAVLVIAVLIARSQISNPYDALARVDPLECQMTVRGPGDEEFGRGYREFSAGNYDEAIRLFERYIRAFPSGDLVDYAHYSAGAACLVSARRNLFGVFPSYDNGLVERGMEHFMVAERSSNLRIVEESSLLHAKGLLMLRRADDALLQLSKTTGLNGVERGKALDLLRKAMEIRGGS